MEVRNSANCCCCCCPKTYFCCSEITISKHKALLTLATTAAAAIPPRVSTQPDQLPRSRVSALACRITTRTRSFDVSARARCCQHTLATQIKIDSETLHKSNLPYFYAFKVSPAAGVVCFKHDSQHFSQQPSLTEASYLSQFRSGRRKATNTCSLARSRDLISKLLSSSETKRTRGFR